MDSEIDKYNKKLRIANEIEGRDEGKCFSYLESCLEILKAYPDVSEQYPTHKHNIEQRIGVFQKKGIEKSEGKVVEDHSEAEVDPELEAEEEPEPEAEEEPEPEAEVEPEHEAEAEPEPEAEVEPEHEAEVESEPEAEEEPEPETGVELEPEPEELVVPDFSDVSPSMEVVESSSVPDVLVIQNMYDLLLDRKSPTYEDYIAFYSSMNALYENLQGPIIYQQGDLVYYIGDTHGSYEETRVMIKYFEQIIKRNPGGVNIVFDGDYVDRNPQDLENLTLIIAFFLQNPQNVSILRGNHEDTMINQHYGFLKNLKKAFHDETKVSTLYGHILTMFTRLPIIHVFTLESQDPDTPPKRIFTVHGGIPINEETPTIPVVLSQLEKEINPEVPSYETFDEFTTWILWSDPKENMDGFELHPETGRNFFGEDLFDRFMKANNLDFMVRAHEVLKNGSKFFFNDRLLSIFSTSFYKNKRIGAGSFARFTATKDSLMPDLLPIDSMMLDIDLATME